MRWTVIEPDGNEIRVDSLTRYCAEKGLEQGNMWRVARCKSDHTKKYRVIDNKLYESDPVYKANVDDRSRFSPGVLSVMAKLLGGAKGRRHKFRRYMVITPRNKVEYTTNMQEYSKNRGLNKACMCLVARGKRSHHKGYVVRYIPE